MAVEEKLNPIIGRTLFVCHDDWLTSTALWKPPKLNITLSPISQYTVSGSNKFPELVIL